MMNLKPAIESYLSRIRIPIRLSCTSPNGYSVVVSLWYLYRDGKIYCVSEEKAKIISYLDQNPKCGFEIAADTPPYCGLRGYGDVNLTPDVENSLLKELYHRYFSNDNSTLYQFLMEEDRNEIIIEIEPRQIFTWDFSRRMADANPLPKGKICPS